MTSAFNTKFALKPVVAALALAAAAGSAIAAPTPNQMPGAGIVTTVSLGSTTVVGTPYINLVSGTNIAVDGKVIIRWGGATPPPGEITNPFGFNLGSNALLGFTGATAGSAVLNIDASGNPSQLYGVLIGNPAAGFTPAMFVANANGIVVGAGGRIVAPVGVGLIGANLDNATSRNEFVANNGWVVPAAPALGVSYLSYGTIPAAGNVSIAGAINGDLTLNKPAQYIFVAGNNIDVLNTGNLFGITVSMEAGIVATNDLQAVNGASNQTVNRIFNVDLGRIWSCCTVDPLPGNFAVVPGITGNVTNEGSISAAGTAPTEWLLIGASGNIRSGILGSVDNQVGLYSDQGIYIDSYSNTSKVELYNVVSGYTTNKTLPFLEVNKYATYYSGFRPDVTLEAIKPGGQPSTITTTDHVLIWGGNVAINSTINHTNAANGGAQTDVDLLIDGSESVSISADIGAGQDVIIVSGGPLTISGNVFADQNLGGVGGIYIFNDGADAPTTISGSLFVPASSGDGIEVFTNGPTTFTDTSSVINVNGWVDIHNDGTGAGNHTTLAGYIYAGDWFHVENSASKANKPLTISGDVVAWGDLDVDNLGDSAGNTTVISGTLTSLTSYVDVYHLGLPTGKLTVSGSISADTYAYLYSDGHAQIGMVDAGTGIYADVYGTTFTIDGPWTAGNFIDIFSPLAQTKLTPDAVLTAPNVYLEGLSYKGVNAAGATYVDPSEKPAAQIVTNYLEVMLTGSINGPIAGTTNWLVNSMDIEPLFPLAPVGLSITANGGGFQAVNLRVLGDAWVNSGATTTPFIGVPLTTGGLPAGGLQGNLGSQLIVQADGYLEVYGTPTGTLFGPPQAFQWPGGALFSAGTTLQTFTPIYNAWSVASPPFGGVFFEAPYIALGGIIATSGTAWANFSTQPVTGDPVVYQIRQLTPTAFGFVATTEFVHNAYSFTVTGGAPCIVTGPTTWTACP